MTVYFGRVQLPPAVTAAAAVALLVLGGVLFGPLRSCTGDPQPVYVQSTDTVRVPIETIREREPDTIIRWRDRIMTRTLPAETVLIATGPPEPDVRLFCAPSVARALRDTAAAPHPSILIRSLTVQRGMFFAPDRLTITAPVSTGGAIQFIHRPHPGFSVRVAGDSLITRESRWWWGREGFEAAVWLGIGYGAAQLVQ